MLTSRHATLQNGPPANVYRGERVIPVKIEADIGSPKCQIQQYNNDYLPMSAANVYSRNSGSGSCRTSQQLSGCKFSCFADRMVLLQRCIRGDSATPPPSPRRTLPSLFENFLRKNISKYHCFSKNFQKSSKKP